MWAIIIVIIGVSARTVYDNFDYVLVKLGVTEGLPYKIRIDGVNILVESVTPDEIRLRV